MILVVMVGLILGRSLSCLVEVVLRLSWFDSVGVIMVKGCMIVVWVEGFVRFVRLVVVDSIRRCNRRRM